jgi:hypothetical protein
MTMSQETIEARLARLEEQVSWLMRERSDEGQPPADAWERTVGMFRGDPVVAEMIEGARRIREEDRRKAREAAESDAE